MIGPFLVVALLVSGPVQADEGTRGWAIARHVARSVGLFATYTGRLPRTLDELTRKPADVRFWPDGGFWTGPLPDSVQWKNGTVTCGEAKRNADSPSHSPVVPPTERLRRQYTAWIQIRLLRSTARAYWEEHARFPTKAGDLGGIPKDPWGDPYVVEFLKDRLRIRSASFRERLLGPEDVTPEEERSLDLGAAVSMLSREQLLEIERQLDRMADDDYETRLEATAELKRKGPVVRTFLERRRSKVKDTYVRRWLARLAAEFPERPPAWKEELRPLSTVLMARVDPRAWVACSNNLSQLWKMQMIYRSQYGGRMKTMAKETGKDFWLALARTPRPLIDPSNIDIFVCPASGLKAEKDRCSYAGPKRDVNTSKDYGQIVGMCDDEAHGDQVVILRRTGDANISNRYGSLHRQALKETKR